MHNLSNKNHRALAKSIFSRLNSIYNPSIGKSMGLRDLDEIIIYIRGHSKETEKNVKSILQDQLSISSIGISCIGLISLSLSPEDDPDELFPRNWLVASDINPNLVLSNMLGHLSNYGISVQTLIEKGLDAQARAQLRLLIELSWLILALIDDRDLWLGYVRSTEANENSFWSKNLKAYQLNRRLNNIEKKMGLSDDLLEELRRTRKSIYSEYSDIVHHSFTSVMLGSMAFTENSENIKFGVFGEPDSASKATLEQLNYVLWYFSLTFFSILEKIHNFSPKRPEKDFWFEAFSLNACLKDIWLYDRGIRR